MTGIVHDPLWRAWARLLLLSLASTGMALSVDAGFAGPPAGVAILVLAYVKARLILARYLGLARTPFWNRGFGFVIGCYMALLLTLYAIPSA